MFIKLLLVLVVLFFLLNVKSGTVQEGQLKISPLTDET